ncbi:MAG: cell division protein FtsK [Actinomycetales bacterium]|nr:cell division protein FtsK [Actinomycetales bacterium]
MERLRVSRPRVWWPLFGAPVALWRLACTWRVLCEGCDLVLPARHATRYGLLTSGSRRHRGGGVIVRGAPVRVIVPRRVGLRLTSTGFMVTVRLFASQTPGAYAKAAEAMAHAWRVHAVRVACPRPGTVTLTAIGFDPLRHPGQARSARSGGGTGLAGLGSASGPRVPVVRRQDLAVEVGSREDGTAWVIDLVERPHHLVTGATRSGKSTLTAALIAGLAPHRVALVGIDAKGGMELDPFTPRLSNLATTRAEAVAVTEALVDEVLDRMGTCRINGVRSVWDLPVELRPVPVPVPVVVVVDEVAEIFLYADRSGRDEATRCVTALVRLAQLGAALGVHLWVAGQRFGSDLGPGATLLRAQLVGRICHRVADVETAEMTLAGLPAEAVQAALQIPTGLPGVAVVGDDSANWTRARSVHLDLDEAIATAHHHADLRVDLPEVTAALDQIRCRGRHRDDGPDDNHGGEPSWR